MIFETLISALFFIAVIEIIINQYKKCPSDRILVIYNRKEGFKTPRCIHGGGAFVIPLVQDYGYLSLDPISITIDLTGMLTKDNCSVIDSALFTYAVSIDSSVTTNAVDKLLGLPNKAIEELSKDIIFNQMHKTIERFTFDEINKDKKKFLEQITLDVNPKLVKIGMEIMNIEISYIDKKESNI